MSGNHDCSKEVQDAVGSALHQIRTRALRDAPFYLQHVSSAQDALNAIISGLIREELVNALEGGEGYIRTRLTQLVPEAVA